MKKKVPKGLRKSPEWRKLAASGYTEIYPNKTGSHRDCRLHIDRN